MHRRALAVSAFVLSMFMLLTGVLVALPVEHAEADSFDLGPDGYFSTMSDGEMPMRSEGATADGARKVLFGKSGSAIPNAAKMVESGDADTAQVDGKYLVLGKGPNDNTENRSPRANNTHYSWVWSKTTQLAPNEVLLWADDVITTPFTFAAGSLCSGYPCNTFDAGIADTETKRASVESYVAKVSQQLGSDTYYSDVELNQMGATTQLPGVCTKGAAAGCSSGFNSSDQTDSVGSYRVFPLSTGDMAEYFNADDGISNTAENNKRQCPETACNSANGASGSWLRSAYWISAYVALGVRYDGYPDYYYTDVTGLGLRPAVRLELDNLLLSAHSGNQSQVLNAPDSASPDSLRLTFVDAETSVVLSKTPYIEQDAGVGGKWVLRDLEGSSNLESQSGLGWKLVDPEDVSGGVVASGRTNYDAAAKSDGNMVVPCETLTPGKDYILSMWGQQDGSDTVGWSNRATVPVTGTVTADGDGVCALNIKSPPSYGIELTGRSDGALTAYKIGDYSGEVFDQTGALKSVRLDTPTVPSGLKTVLKNAAETAGGSDVDAGNPMGWVASQWLGYPTDPLSDDVTSAFSPYAGSLQVFAQELAKHTDALGASAGSLPAGTFPQPESTETLPVSGPGLYLIVDSTQSSGGSLPIIVGTKVFNEALEDVVEDGMVDFADAGVKGKPRLGRAALKTSVTDVAKRVVNDDGLDGFDVGSVVEFEVALRVPELSTAFASSSVSYGSYVFGVEDAVKDGLVLQSGTVEVFVDALSPTEPVDIASTGVSVVVAGDGKTLRVDGLKALFATDGASPVANKTSVPVGSLIRVRYAAVLAAGDGTRYAAPGGGNTVANVNEVKLTRSHAGTATTGWADNEDGTEWKTAASNVYSFKVDVVKVDKDDASKKLGGATFKVSRDGNPLKFKELSDGVYRLDATGGAEVETASDGTGKLTLLGVEARELSFKETKAPDEYFKVSDFGVEVVPVWYPNATEVELASYRTSGTNLAYVSQDGHSVTVADPSKSLANLPYTGGVGILLLLIIGGAFLMFAVRPYYLSHCAEATANILI